MRGQRMPVGHEEQAFVLVLQPDPVLEHAVVVAKMKAPGGAHAREYAVGKHDYLAAQNSIQGH
jgi:hypothetical protein